ncbi:hypothetical protein [Flavobacterium sp. SORGH_AS_0622]|uniref:hypothetical protein n=1 Tax=Flavobacterium sp. SORGH_AS_0622 TaxID=3041772 RepID=UPI0027885663|nr:hypothetical protein [Flavobacterium sp. SORGH_AS_0622]MDQ1165684.1 hypothetical protein [Flavobacterium sp. SORGH_AS_0622]
MNIIVSNIIEQNKITINFDPQDGTLSFPSVDLTTTGDIDLNPLILKLTDLLELDNKLEIQYDDEHSLADTDSKIKLVKETLDDIYKSFNQNILSENEIINDDDDF